MRWSGIDFGRSGLGVAGRGGAWHGKARPGTAGRGRAGRGMAGHGGAWHGKATSVGRLKQPQFNKQTHMNVLVGCEYSGTVRDAFAARGHDAWSCDLLPSEKPGNHFCCDVFSAVSARRWDLVILHPPCTALCLAGNRHYGTGNPKQDERTLALVWTEQLVKHARHFAKSVAVEQPASVLCRVLGKRTQEIQPWQFGHPEQKKTWLWLYNLPPLQGTKCVWDEMKGLPKSKRERVFFMSPGPNRGHERSRFYPGIAAAMAEQWATHI